jgi:hypothetical protein
MGQIFKLGCFGRLLPYMGTNFHCEDAFRMVDMCVFALGNY